MDFLRDIFKNKVMEGKSLSSKNNFINEKKLWVGWLLYCIEGLVIAAQCTATFQICCAPPNLGIRTWICRLNFAQRPIFQALGSLTSLKSQTRDPQLKVHPGGLVLRILTSWKNPSTSAGFEPANTLPRDHRGRLQIPLTCVLPSI